MSDYTVCHKSGQLVFLKLTLIVFIWFYDEIQNMKILERGKHFKFWLWNLLCSLFCTSKIWCPICKKNKAKNNVDPYSTVLIIKYSGRNSWCSSGTCILPAPSYFARVIKYFNRSPIPTLWIISSTEYVWDHAKKISFFSFAYDIWLILKMHGKYQWNTQDGSNCQSSISPCTLIPLLGNSQIVLPPLCICH